MWTGQEYIVTAGHGNSYRAVRVSPAGEAFDAPYGLWLAQAGHSHVVAYGSGRLILVSQFGGLVTDRQLRTPVAFAVQYFAAALGGVAIREDGAALFTYTAQSSGATTLAYVRTIP